MNKSISVKPIISTWVHLEKDKGLLVSSSDYYREMIYAEDDKGIEVMSLGVMLNGKEPEETYDVAPFMRTRSDYQRGYSWDEFLTCSCGHGGCAGYYDGIYIHFKKKRVSWTGKRSSGYRNGVIGTGPQVVWFDRKEYQAVGEYFKNLFKSKPYGIFQINEFLFTGSFGSENFK